jgi:ribose transport system substrate-binding protein
VVLLAHDSLQFLAPRFVAMRDVLNEMPGVSIVADISPVTVNKEGGLAIMRTILLAHPEIDVVLGADTVVPRGAGGGSRGRKERPDQFFGGIDGEPEAVAEIKRGGPYKSHHQPRLARFRIRDGTPRGRMVGRKSIPQAIDILPRALTLENMGQYEADIQDPAQVYFDPLRRVSYLKSMATSAMTRATDT